MCPKNPNEHTSVDGCVLTVRDSLVSPRSEFNLKHSEDGSVVWSLDAGAAVVFQHRYVVGLPAPEQDPVLPAQNVQTV